MEGVNTVYLVDRNKTVQEKPRAGALELIDRIRNTLFGPPSSLCRFDVSDVAWKLFKPAHAQAFSFDNAAWEWTVDETLEGSELALPDHPAYVSEPLSMRMVNSVCSNHDVLLAPLVGMSIGYLLSGGRCRYPFVRGLVLTTYRNIAVIGLGKFLWRQWGRHDRNGTRDSIVGFGKELYTDMRQHGKVHSYEEWKEALEDKPSCRLIPRALSRDPILSQTNCPITGNPIRYPVYKVLENGQRQYFEQAAIIAWLEAETNGSQNPWQSIKKSDLVFDVELSNRIEKRLLFAKVALYDRFPGLKLVTEPDNIKLWMASYWHRVLAVASTAAIAALCILEQRDHFL